jgi:8-oxo-dGTP pyrophosphatase MutT (NUDIX family)
VKAQLKEILACRQKRYIDDRNRVPSAVLIPLYRKQGQCHIVLIKRTETVKEHKGQISFPGGARDNSDHTLLDTAVRESHEEIGLRPGDIEVIGELDDEITTTSNYIVTPFVAVIPWPYRFTINKAEVDEIIEAPIAALLSRDCLKPDIETLDGGIVVDSYNYHYDGRLIWGATARILNKFLALYSQAVPDVESAGEA